jgi:hypothetical protein
VLGDEDDRPLEVRVDERRGRDQELAAEGRWLRHGIILPVP